eukprot:421609_1
MAEICQNASKEPNLSFRQAESKEHISVASEVSMRNTLHAPTSVASTHVEVQRVRPRRNRKSAAVRSMVRENIVTPSNFIYPLFIHDED